MQPSAFAHAHSTCADDLIWFDFCSQVPVVIDVMFKYWIFVGLNKISPGAVVTIKQIDTH